MAMEHKSRTIRVITNHTNEAGKSETDSLDFKGIDPEATESMMNNFCKGIEDVSSDTPVSRKYVDVYELTSQTV